MRLFSTGGAQEHGSVELHTAASSHGVTRTVPGERGFFVRVAVCGEGALGIDSYGESANPFARNKGDFGGGAHDLKGANRGRNLKAQLDSCVHLYRFLDIDMHTCFLRRKGHVH